MPPRTIIVGGPGTVVQPTRTVSQATRAIAERMATDNKGESIAFAFKAHSGSVPCMMLPERVPSSWAVPAAGGVGAPPVVSIMAVNNEVGSIQPVVEMARLVHDLAPGALVHTDAVQAMGWLDLRTIGPEVDLLTLSAHKFGGPHGVGACVVRKSAAIAPRQLGGGQERDRRSGTLNVASIMAMTAAAVEADALRSVERSRIGALRDRLVDAVIGSVPGAIHTGVPPVGDAAGDRSHLAEGFAHFCFEDLENEALLFLLDEAGISASAASACASGAQHPSHVLDAMGIAGPLAAGSLRLSLGHDTTEVDVDRAVDAVVASVNRLRRYRS